MDPISIASDSVNLSLSQTQQAAGISVMKKAINFEQSSALSLVQDLGSLNPNVGQSLDVQA